MKSDQDLKQKWQELKESIKSFWAVASSDRAATTPADAERTDQQHVMSDDEKVDEYISESFPASDPPAHHRKSAEDKKVH